MHHEKQRLRYEIRVRVSLYTLCSLLSAVLHTRGSEHTESEVERLECVVSPGYECPTLEEWNSAHSNCDGLAATILDLERNPTTIYDSNDQYGDQNLDQIPGFGEGDLYTWSDDKLCVECTLQIANSLVIHPLPCTSECTLNFNVTC